MEVELNDGFHMSNMFKIKIIVPDSVMINDEGDMAQLHINATEEGLIIDVVANGEVIKTSSATYQELSEECQ